MIADGFDREIAGLFVCSLDIGVILPHFTGLAQTYPKGIEAFFCDKMGAPRLLFTMTQLTLPSILHWILSHRRLLMIWLVFGLVIGVLVVKLTPERYEASFVVKMPVSNAVNQNNQILDKEIQFVPNPIEVKKLFLRPEAFSSSTVLACGFTDSNGDRKSLVNAVTSEVAEYGSAIMVTVRLPGKDRVSVCANALMADAITFADTEKNRALAFIRQFNPAVVAMVNQNAYAPYSVRISSNQASPNPWKIIFGFICFSLVLGVWLSITWTQLVRRLGDGVPPASVK